MSKLNSRREALTTLWTYLGVASLVGVALFWSGLRTHLAEAQRKAVLVQLHEKIAWRSAAELAATGCYKLPNAVEGHACLDAVRGISPQLPTVHGAVAQAHQTD